MKKLFEQALKYSSGVGMDRQKINRSTALHRDFLRFCVKIASQLKLGFSVAIPRHNLAIVTASVSFRQRIEKRAARLGVAF